jgi:hypothetical protein
VHCRLCDGVYFVQDQDLFSHFQVCHPLLPFFKTPDSLLSYVEVCDPVEVAKPTTNNLYDQKWNHTLVCKCKLTSNKVMHS